MTSAAKSQPNRQPKKLAKKGPNAKHVPATHAARHADNNDPLQQHLVRHQAPAKGSVSDGVGKKGSEKDGRGKKDSGKKGPGKDLRRAYEHLARISVLAPASRGDAPLTALAERLGNLAVGGVESAEHAPEHAKAAAELARAAEHTAFAAALSNAPDSPIEWTDDLDGAWRREFSKLEADAQFPRLKKPAKKKNRLDEDDEADAELRDMLQTLTGAAAEARKASNYAQSLECMRAAAALVEAAIRLGYGE
jgi:hypothetical protein